MLPTPGPHRTPRARPGRATRQLPLPGLGRTEQRPGLSPHHVPGKALYSPDALAREPRGLRPRREWRKSPQTPGKGKARTCSAGTPSSPHPPRGSNGHPVKPPSPARRGLSPFPAPSRHSPAPLPRSPHHSAVTAISSLCNRHGAHNSRLGNAYPRNHCFPLSSLPPPTDTNPPKRPQAACSAGERASARPASLDLTLPVPAGGRWHTELLELDALFPPGALVKAEPTGAGE